MSTPPRVSIVIPTLNEEWNIPHVFAGIPDDTHEVILVDGRSVDNTVEVAQKLLVRDGWRIAKFIVSEWLPVCREKPKDSTSPALEIPVPMVGIQAVERLSDNA